MNYFMPVLWLSREDLIKLYPQRSNKMSDEIVETMIQEAGKDAPRITAEHIESVIDSVAYHQLTPVLTVCVITLVNGFHVTGESACASPENFDREIGEHIAYRNAEAKIWLLEGYLLKERIFLGLSADLAFTGV